MSGIDALLKNKMARVTAGRTEENTLNLNPEFDDDKPIVDSGKQGRRNQEEGQWEETSIGQAGLGFAGKFNVRSKEEVEKNKRKAQQESGPVESTWDADMQATVLTQEDKKDPNEKPKKTGAGVLSAAQGKKGPAIMRPSQQMGEVYFPALGEEPPARKEEHYEAPKSTGWDDAPQPSVDADGKPRFVNKKKVVGGPIDTISPIEEKPAPVEEKKEEFVTPMKFTNTKAGGNFKPLESNKAREEKEKAIEAELALKREQAIAQRKKDEDARTAALLNRDERKPEPKKEEKAEEPIDAEFAKPMFKNSKVVNNNINPEVLASEKFDEEKAKRDKEKAEREKEKAERAEKGDKFDKSDRKKKDAPKAAPAKVEAPVPAAEEKPKVEKPNALGKFVPQEQHGVAHLAGWE